MAQAVKLNIYPGSLAGYSPCLVKVNPRAVGVNRFIGKYKGFTNTPEPAQLLDNFGCQL